MLSDTRMLLIHISYVIQLIVAQTIFSFRFPRRKLFVLRVLAAVVVYFIAAIFLPENVFGLDLHLSLNTLGVFTCLILATKFLFAVSWKTAVIGGTGTALVQHLGSQTFRFLTAVFPVDDSFEMIAMPFVGSNSYRLCFFAGYIIAYTTAWFFVIAKNRRYLTMDLKSWQMVILMLVSVLIVYIIGDIAIHEGGMDMIVHIVPTAICCMLLLNTLCATGKSNRLEEDERIMRRLLTEEQKHYDRMMSSIETVNRKCHDLKYQIAAMRGMSGKERERQLEKLEKDVVIYENLARTGNVALDNTLSEKCLVCENKGIRFTYNIDGKMLSFMDAPDVYILFGNALDNAIECVEKYSEDKRIISLNTFKKGQLFKIRIENRCEETVDFNGGVKTSKADKTSHGFGIGSMRLVAEKYNGNLAVSARDGTFRVDILFQLS